MEERIYEAEMKKIRQYNCNTYINQSVDLCGSSLLALKKNNYIRAHILEYYLYSHQASYYVQKSENLKGELEKLEPCAR